MTARGLAVSFVRRALLPTLLLLSTILLWSGAYGPKARAGSPLGIALAVAFLGLAWAVVRRALRSLDRTPPPPREVVELGLSLLVASLVVTQLTGGMASSFYPMVYLLCAFFVAFLPTAPALVLVASAVGLDAGIFAFGNLGDPWLLLATHIVFTCLFAALYHAVLAARLKAAAHAERGAVERHVREAELRAREYRLTSAAHGPDAAEAAGSWMLASVGEVESLVRGALEVAHQALSAHSTALFLLSIDDVSLKLRECVSASDAVDRAAMSAGEGPLGSVVKQRLPVRLCGSLRSFSYYTDRVPVKAFCAVPLLEPAAQGEARVRGVLLADRLEAVPFTPEELSLLERVAAQVLRAVETERVMTAIRREKDEKERFYRAIEELNRAVKPPDVTQAAVRLARELCANLDCCLLTLFEQSASGGRHVVAAALGDGAESLAGRTFDDNTGLVSTVVRLGASLPGRPVDEMDRVVVLDEDAPLPKLSALRIFPLHAGDRTVGTLVAMSTRRGVFDGESRHRLQILALQAAEALVRAQLFETAERLATTDGLTGLHNHRRMQELLDAAFKQAHRYGRKVSLLLLDIDHFKNVNDRYGHPAGDAVLRGVATMLAAQARDSDVVARYGGEEFAVALPETDRAGALVIAERIRAAIERVDQLTDSGPVRVTVSIGVATFPDDARDKASLVECADKSLYAAKHGGRNRVVATDLFPSPLTGAGQSGGAPLHGFVPPTLALPLKGE